MTEPCRSDGIKSVDRAIVVLEVLVIDSDANIPACTGTKPHVTTTMAVEAQKTAQCLKGIRKADRYDESTDLFLTAENGTKGTKSKGYCNNNDSFPVAPSGFES
jgi:hypothetical protein